MIYEVDFRLLVTRILGTWWRTADRIAWLVTCLAKIQALHNELLSFRAEKLRELSYNSQTHLFDRLLNDKFPNPGNRIFIQNSSSRLSRLYIYKLQENERPSYIKQLLENPTGPYIYSLTDLTNVWDFIVFVPTGLVYDAPKMNSLIRKYKLAGKRYTIKSY